MRIDSLSSRNINSKSLRVSYDAKRRILNTDEAYIKALLQVGRKNENNQFIDILVHKNLHCTIKQKANPFFSFKEPIKLIKKSDNKIRISAVYDGKEGDIYNKGDEFNVDMEYPRPDIVESIMQTAEPLIGLFKISYIAKLIDDYFVKTKCDPIPRQTTKEELTTLLMDKYGDFMF